MARKTKASKIPSKSLVISRVVVKDNETKLKFYASAQTMGAAQKKLAKCLDNSDRCTISRCAGRNCKVTLVKGTIPANAPPVPKTVVVPAAVAAQIAPAAPVVVNVPAPAAAESAPAEPSEPKAAAPKRASRRVKQETAPLVFGFDSSTGTSRKR